MRSWSSCHSRWWLLLLHCCPGQRRALCMSSTASASVDLGKPRWCSRTQHLEITSSVLTQMRVGHAHRPTPSGPGSLPESTKLTGGGERRTSVWVGGWAGCGTRVWGGWAGARFDSSTLTRSWTWTCEGEKKKQVLQLDCQCFNAASQQLARRSRPACGDLQRAAPDAQTRLPTPSRSHCFQRDF